MRPVCVIACVVALAVVTACNQLIGIPDLERGPCDPGADFVGADPVGGLDSGSDLQNAWLAPDERTIVFSRITVGGTAELPTQRYGDLYIAERDDLTDDFGAPRPLAELSSELDEYAASLTDDLRTIYFDRQGQDGRYRILVATRSTATDPFGPPTPLELGNDGSDFEPYVTANTIYFASTRLDGIASLYAAPGRGASFEEPQWMESLETMPSPTAYENPIVSADQLAIYFSAPPDPTLRPRDIWMAERPHPSLPFDRPRQATSINTPGNETPSWISNDGCRLYFVTDRGGQGSRLWIAWRRAA